MRPTEVPDWVTFPEDDWEMITPDQAGLDPGKFSDFIASRDVKGASFGGEDHTDDKYGAVITRGGYLVHSWGDRSYRFQTASVGKALTWIVLGLAAEEGRIDPDKPINKTWTGEDELSHAHKHLDHGHHKSLTWRHLIGRREESAHWGGFPMERGDQWMRGRQDFENVEEADLWIPAWAEWTGDAFYDLYSHVEPGTRGHYSSAGFWRLSQALTLVWDRDIKEVIQERLFDRIGIPSDRWDWMTGRDVHEDRLWYPAWPDTYTFLDPPYEVNGHPVRSGPGWVVISASDWARFGLLVATRGVWKGQQLIDPQWVRGHGGGNKSGSSGESKHYTAMGVVTTDGLTHPHTTDGSCFLPEDVFVGPVKPTRQV